jgi:hypothetical protein
MAGPSNETKALAATIAAQLGETEPTPLGEIQRIVHRLGAETALAFLAETQQLEAQGGLLLPDGSRRRTPGGVFFYLVKQRISKKERLKIFYPLGQPPQAEPAYVDGEVRKVKLTVVGRPEHTVEQAGYIRTTLQLRRAPALPKGLPAFPEQPTSYTLYIAAKQWRRVAEALQDPEDVLVVEGVPTSDAQQPGIVVYVTMATTKKLQAAKRQMHPPSGEH